MIRCNACRHWKMPRNWKNRMDRAPGGKIPHDWSKDFLPCKLLPFSDFTETEVELEVGGDMWMAFRTRGDFGCVAGEERK